MTTITILGSGNMATVIAALALKGRATVQVLSRDPLKASTVIPGATHGPIHERITGDIVIPALPYPAIAEVLAEHSGQFEGKTVVDITNPVDFTTFDSLVVAAGSSATAELAQVLPGSSVLKAFNTNFAATLNTGTVAGIPTTVLIAGDDSEAKNALAAVVGAAGMRAVDAGSLKRAHELEAIGFLQLALAVQNKTSWTTGFAIGS